MYAGAKKNADGTLTSWMQFSHEELGRESILAIRQDVKLLNANAVGYCLEKPLARIAARRRLRPEEIDWFLPHMSSEYFRQPIASGLAKIGLPIPPERWFTNLTARGNTGSASPVRHARRTGAQRPLAPGGKDVVLRAGIGPVHQRLPSSHRRLMHANEVPERSAPLFEGRHKAVYVVDEHGRYLIAKSGGTEAEVSVTEEAVSWFARLAAEARERARRGETSPLEVHMYRQRMDLPTLAQATGFCAGRCAAICDRPGLPGERARPRRYAEALGLSLAQLQSLD